MPEAEEEFKAGREGAFKAAKRCERGRLRV